LLCAGGSDAAGEPRPSHPGAGIDQRAGCATRHHPRRDEEARAGPRGGGAGHHREGRADPALPPGARAPGGSDALDPDLPAAVGAAPRRARGLPGAAEQAKGGAGMSYELRVERVLNATADEVWAAYTDAEAAKVWFKLGPDGPNDSIVEITNDLRVGGEWNAAWGDSPGRLFRERGVYQVVDRPRRLLMAHTGWTPDGESMDTTVEV